MTFSYDDNEHNNLEVFHGIRFSTMLNNGEAIGQAVFAVVRIILMDRFCLPCSIDFSEEILL